MNKINKKAFEMAGLLLALGIQGPLVAFDSICVNSTNTELDTTTSAVVLSTVQPLPPPELSVWDEHKYLFISLILNVFFVIGYILLLTFVKEDIGIFTIFIWSLLLLLLL